MTDWLVFSLCPPLGPPRDGQCWIKRTWSLIMHSSVMQPSVATNLETETSPGLLSALLGIYGLPYRWFTAYSYGKRLCELLGRSSWSGVRTYAFPGGGGGEWRSLPQESPAALPRCQTECKLICQTKMCTAQYFCMSKRPEGRNSCTVRKSINNKCRDDQKAWKTNGQCD